MTPLEISWSFLAFKRVGEKFAAVNDSIKREVDEIASKSSEWFLHTQEVENGPILKCDGKWSDGRWYVYVREALYVAYSPESKVRFPEAIDDPDNKKFATVDAIFAELKQQQKGRRSFLRRPVLSALRKLLGGRWRL